MIVLGALLTRACATCGLAGLLSLAAGSHGAQATDARWTLTIQLSTRDARAMVGLVRALESRRGRVAVSASRGTLRLAGPPGEVERIAHVIREVDEPEAAGLRVWTIPIRGWPEDMARKLPARAVLP